jgi:nucleoside-diphosphate-sugar epimerase
MKILVTGGSGFLGTHVTNFLGADDFSRRNGCDILNPRDVAAISEYDVVIHLAAQLDKSPENADDVFLHNVEGTINVLKAVKKDAAFIFASTKEVYGRFADTYETVAEYCPTTYSGQSALEWSKLIAEKYVAYYGNVNNFRTCIFRMSTVYGPNSEDNRPNFVTHYADMINRGETVRLPGGGSPVRDILHVDDFSKACRAFMDSVIRHGLYNIGGGHRNALSLRELFERMEEISGYQGVIDNENPLPKPVPMNYVTNIDLIAQELDWVPTISVDDGIRTLFGPAH